MSIHVGGLTIDQTLTGITSQFIYDTKTDSDGGAWRHRCQHTSWFNETASSTRSSRKEFPEVALLVTNQYNFYIYDLDNVKDGTTGEVEVWMKFEGGGQDKFLWHNNSSGTKLFDATAKNGYIAIAIGNATANSYVGYYWFNLVSEHAERQRSLTTYRTWNAGLAQRNVGTTVGWGEGSYIIPAPEGGIALTTQNCTSVHMFAHRGNNIDPDTGTLVPSIAIGMGMPEQPNSSGNPGAVYMIMGDGKRYTKTMAQNYCPYEGLCFNDYGDIVISRDNYDYVVIEEAARSVGGANHPSGWSAKAYYRSGSGTKFPYPMIKRYQSNGEPFAPAGNLSTKGVCAVDNEVILWSNQTGITKWWVENHWGGANQLGCYITSTFNTGWMYAKCIGMHLCSTNTNTLGSTGTQLATNHTFASNVTGWYGDSGASVTHSTDNGQDGQSGIARVTNGGGDNTFAIKQNDVFTPEDRIGPTFIGAARYRVTFSIKPTFASASYTLRVRAGGNATQWQITSGLTNGAWSSHDTGIITADGTALEIGSLAGTINSFDIDNIVVTLMSDTDKTVENKELYLNGNTGSITRTPVETGAELVGWGNFASDRFLRTDYTANYNFGNSMTVMFWYRDWADGTSLMHLGPEQTRNSKTSFHFYKDGGGDIRWTLSSDGNTEQVFEIELTENPVGWHHVCATLTSSGEVFLFHDGVERPKTSDSASSFTGTNIFSQATDQNGLNVGIGPVGGAFGGKIALLKLNSEQIYPPDVLKIYTDELKMFQSNAKITLDGTDSEIKSMAADQVRKTYIAGTSTHRSEFRGLVRINSVDTGVATLNTLTASDGIVAFE